MGFWIFGRKDDDFEDRFQRLHETLKLTFSNIREDIDRLHKWTENTHENTQDHRLKLREHELRLLKIENQLNSIVSTMLLREQAPTPLIEEKRNFRLQEELPLEEGPERVQKNEIFSSLTKTQLDLFKTIYQIQKQTNSNKVSLRSIANLHYSGKLYNSVRSTISDYLTILHTWGLIKKQRVGKESFVAITKNGLDLIQETKEKRQKIKKKVKV
ncbi:hypothetical protein HYT57_02295 [Candidatus Woesearchaeota archaeon]|nr:hypothetical protein [Candidatus Woesearchaeota archaeon]